MSNQGDGASLVAGGVEWESVGGPTKETVAMDIRERRRFRLEMQPSVERMKMFP